MCRSPGPDPCAYVPCARGRRGGAAGGWWSSAWGIPSSRGSAERAGSWPAARWAMLVAAWFVVVGLTTDRAEGTRPAKPPPGRQLPPYQTLNLGNRLGRRLSSRRVAGLPERQSRLATGGWWVTSRLMQKLRQELQLWFAPIISGDRGATSSTVGFLRHL